MTYLLFFIWHLQCGMVRSDINSYLTECPRNFFELPGNPSPYVAKILHDIFIMMFIIFHEDCIVYHMKKKVKFGIQ